MCWIERESGSRFPSFLSSVIDWRADSSERARCAGERCTCAFKVRVDKGMIEEPECKLDAQNGADGAIKIRLRERAFVHAIDERLLKDVVVEVIKLHVDARPDGQAGRHPCGVRGNVMRIV